MIKVIHLITGLNTGGAEMMLYKLISTMDKTNYDNIVISLMDKGVLGDSIEGLGIKLYTLNMNQGVPSFKSLRVLKKILSEEKPHILQTWMYHADFLGLISRIFYKKSKMIWNIRCSNMDFKKYSFSTFLVVKICSFFSNIPSAIIVNSKNGLEKHIELGYKSKRWELIFNGFDIDKFHPKTIDDKRTWDRRGENKDVKYFATVARYDFMKGYDILIDAFQLLKCKLQQNKVVGVFYGKNVDDDNLELMNQKYKHDIKEEILLKGEKNNIHEILPYFDFYVSPSRFGEGFSNVIGEAMACGLPIIATNVGDSSMIVGDCGLIVPPEDPPALAEAINIFCRMSPVELEKIGMRGRIRIEEQFTIQKIAKQYEAIYYEVNQ